jgi:hypothetical protein
VYADDVRTVGGEVLKNARATDLSSNGVRILHDDGGGFFAWSSIAAEDREILGYSKFVQQQEAIAKENEVEEQNRLKNRRAFLEQSKSKLRTDQQASLADIESILSVAIDTHKHNALQFLTDLFGAPIRRVGPKSGTVQNPITGRSKLYVETDYIFSDAFYDAVLNKKVPLCLRIPLEENLDGKVRESVYIGEPFGSYFDFVAEVSR